MGQRAPEEEPAPPQAALEPSWLAAAAVALCLFLALLSNGRPIGAGDTRPTERAAASLVQEGDLDLDEYPEVEPPFARMVGEHRVSIYPVLSAVLAAPVFAAAAALFALDETGTALAGKVAASAFSALAAALLFLAVSRRHTRRDGIVAAVVLALGTSVWATSQSLWQHPAAVLFLSMAVLFLVRAQDDDVWAGRAGLPLGLAFAARHADVALVAALALAIIVRWPRRTPSLLAWGAPAVLFVAAYQWLYFGSPFRTGFSGTLDRFVEPWGRGHLGLLLSPAKGLLVFTPVVIVCVVGLVAVARARAREVVSMRADGWQQEFTRDQRWLALASAGGVAAHWLLMGRWAEWHGGECFGPRMMTDALPLLLLFLPDGLWLLPRLGPVLAAASIGVQAAGAFAYDYRWERLHQRGATGQDALWSIGDSPLPVLARERVLIAALPVVGDGRAFVREHRVVFGRGQGSRIGFAGDAVALSGSDETAEDVHLLRGARVVDGRLRLAGRWDGLFLRVREGARPRRLELRVAGRGSGVLYVGEQSFWSRAPRWVTHPVNGAFLVRHRYEHATSGGPDITVTIGKSAGLLEIDSVSLVPASDPLSAPLRLP